MREVAVKKRDRAGETAQLVKCLPYKHEDQHAGEKPRTAAHICNLISDSSLSLAI